MSDDKLFNCFDERLQCREREMVCGNKNCICLDIFLSLNVREAVAKYLVWFERKNKYEQDSTIMEWYRYVSKAQMGKSNWYQVRSEFRAALKAKKYKAKETLESVAFDRDCGI